MQGAFEYAVKLWEEVLPMTLPIKIDVKVDNLRGSSDLLSRVSFGTDEYTGDRVNMYACPLSMVKSVLLQEYHSSQRHRFYDEIDDTSILDGTDMTITYNKNKLNTMDFSLDGEIDIAKFDFVTVALRDIAIGLGFTSNITANSSTKMINMTGEKYTPFESLIMNAIGTNPSLAYSIATSGSVDVELRDWGGIPVDTLSIYAPTTWVQGKSLRYFIPDENPITRLLTHDFGTGYVMRDLSGMPAIDLSVLCIPAECNNIKLPIEYEIASRWDANLLYDICRHFASVMLHFASLISHNLRCIPAYTHLIPTGFFNHSLNDYRGQLVYQFH